MCVLSPAVLIWPCGAQAEADKLAAQEAKSSSAPDSHLGTQKGEYQPSAEEMSLAEHYMEKLIMVDTRCDSLSLSPFIGYWFFFPCVKEFLVEVICVWWCGVCGRHVETTEGMRRHFEGVCASRGLNEVCRLPVCLSTRNIHPFILSILVH